MLCDNFTLGDLALKLFRLKRKRSELLAIMATRSAIIDVGTACRCFPELFVSLHVLDRTFSFGSNS